VSDTAVREVERERASSGAPKQIRIAGGLVGVQALGSLTVVVVLVVAGVQAGGAAPGSLWGEAGFFAFLTAGVVAVAVGLLRGRHWARTPAAVLQVLVGAGYYATQPARPDLAAPVAVFCVVVLVLLFVRASRTWAAGRPLPGRGGRPNRS
jgi:hypothetical protein